MSWLGELENISYRNPNRRILFQIDKNLIEESHSYAYSDKAIVSLESILDGTKVDKDDDFGYKFSLRDDFIYDKTEYEDEIMSIINEVYIGITEEEANNVFNSLPWEDVILVTISE